MKQALNLCKKYNLNITRAGLIYAGNQKKFIKKDTDKFHYVVNKKSLLSFISLAIEKAPYGWITILEASEVTRFSIGKLYRMIKEKKIKCRVFGRNRYNYVLKEEIEIL